MSSRQNSKSIVSSNWIKILVLVTISMAMYAAWQYGLETVYARMLLPGTNAALSIVKADTSIALEKDQQDTYQFKIQTRLEGRNASYPQTFGSLLQPFVILLSWQLFLFLAISRKPALQSLAVNFSLYYFLQMIFLILLTGYYSSETLKFFYVMLMDSFYIIALVLVIKDNMLYNVFAREKQ
jgi:hypothetical protein